MRYAERLAGEAAEQAAKADEWLLPSEPGGLEAEGMERTWRFSQSDIVQGAFLSSPFCYEYFHRFCTSACALESLMLTPCHEPASCTRGAMHTSPTLVNTVVSP